MKTQTRAKILKIIEHKGGVRPFELYHFLQISPQAVHRHLRQLVQQGLIEAKGSAPFVHYRLAGIPDLDAVAHWISAGHLLKNPEFVCETREVFTARLSQLKSFVKKGLPENSLPLVISTAGEIGNNSFDHNLGQWRDVPGCWFECQITGKTLWICIADRGQGIFKSLAKVHPNITDEQTALKAAFETIISGRAPEKRGNGLKFVKKTLSSEPGDGVACMSGTARIFYGEQGEQCMRFLKKYLTHVKGTITLVVWKMS